MPEATSSSTWLTPVAELICDDDDDDEHRLRVSVSLKSEAHPWHGRGNRLGYAVNGVEGATLVLRRGQTYRFQVDARGHPFAFTSSEFGGTTNTDTHRRNRFTRWPSPVECRAVSLAVTARTPSHFYYQSSLHMRMGGLVRVIESPQPPTTIDAAAPLPVAVLAVRGSAFVLSADSSYDDVVCMRATPADADTLYVAHRDGLVRALKRGDQRSHVLLDLRYAVHAIVGSRRAHGDERGLMSVELHPRFGDAAADGDNARVFAYYCSTKRDGIAHNEYDDNERPASPPSAKGATVLINDDGDSDGDEGATGFDSIRAAAAVDAWRSLATPRGINRRPPGATTLRRAISCEADEPTRRWLQLSMQRACSVTMAACDLPLYEIALTDDDDSRDGQGSAHSETALERESAHDALCAQYYDVLSEFRCAPTADGQGWAVLSERALLHVPRRTNSNGGGAICFERPPRRCDAGTPLYVALGDDARATTDAEDRVQNPRSLRGKLLRVLVDVPSSSTTTTMPYAIPSDNHDAKGARWAPEVHALGFRAPASMWCDGARRELLLCDVGGVGTNEVNVVPFDDGGGGNYGWPLREGRRIVDARRNQAAMEQRSTLRDPLFEYRTSPLTSDGIVAAISAVNPPLVLIFDRNGTVRGVRRDTGALAHEWRIDAASRVLAVCDAPPPALAYCMIVTHQATHLIVEVSIALAQKTGVSM